METTISVQLTLGEFEETIRRIFCEELEKIKSLPVTPVYDVKEDRPQQALPFEIINEEVYDKYQLVDGYAISRLIGLSYNKVIQMAHMMEIPCTIIGSRLMFKQAEVVLALKKSSKLHGISGKIKHTVRVSPETTEVKAPLSKPISVDDYFKNEILPLLGPKVDKIFKDELQGVILNHGIGVDHCSDEITKLRIKHKFLTEKLFNIMKVVGLLRISRIIGRKYNYMFISKQ